MYLILKGVPIHKKIKKHDSSNLEITTDKSLVIYLWSFFLTYIISILLSSVHFSRSIVSDSLQPHEPQHARPPCQSQTPGVHPNPCPSSQ